MYEHFTETNKCLLIAIIRLFRHLPMVSSLNYDLTVFFYNIAFDEKKFPMLF